MAVRFALASGVVLVLTATATALPTRTKKHRALDARVGGGVDPDEAPDLERAVTFNDDVEREDMETRLRAQFNDADMNMKPQRRCTHVKMKVAHEGGLGAVPAVRQGRAERLLDARV